MSFSNETPLTTVLQYLPAFELSDNIRLPANLSIYTVIGGAIAYVEVCGVTWCLSENGGEIMVEKVNERIRTDELPRAVPTFNFGVPLNGATIAERICCVLCGEAIDFESTISDEDAAIMLGA